MVEINLLPWREYSRARNLSTLKFLMAVMIFLILLIPILYFYRPQPQPQLTTQTVTPDPEVEQIKKIKYVGYLRHHQQLWALLSMPDGKIHDAHVGSRIGNTFRILSLNEAELIVTSASTPRGNSFSQMKILLSHS
jgi:hypothetical protein